MKKIRILSIILFVIATAAFLGCRFYAGIMTDHKPPVISGGDAVEVSVEDTDEKLLAGVTAEDDRDGDVTDSLVVEGISEFDDAGVRTVRYAAVDDSGNVGYFTRAMSYTDYREPEFMLSAPLRFPVGGSFNVCQGISASSVLDGDLSNSIKYTLDRVISTMTTGTYEVEYRVMDSAGKTSYLKTQIEIYDPEEERIEVELSSYLVYLDRNASSTPKDYYAGSSVEDGDLKVKSAVDTSKPGTYYVDYTVEAGELEGKSRLVVVVR